MATLEPFLILASAVAEGRMSIADFSKVCLPLYKNYPDPFPTHEQYKAATDLFYLANDHGPTSPRADVDALSEKQVMEAAEEIARRMRALLS